MRSAVRLPVTSASISPAPQVLRSAGISVFFIQLPFAYAKKSSPGATDLSMPARSIPVDFAPVSDDADAGRTSGVERLQDGVAKRAAAKTMAMERAQSF